MLKSSQKIEDIHKQLGEYRNYFSSLHDRRQESYDKKSDTWKEGEKGDEESWNLSLLEETAENLEDAIIRLEELYEI